CVRLLLSLFPLPTATVALYPLSLHDALPIFRGTGHRLPGRRPAGGRGPPGAVVHPVHPRESPGRRSGPGTAPVRCSPFPLPRTADHGPEYHPGTGYPAARATARPAPAARHHLSVRGHHALHRRADRAHRPDLSVPAAAALLQGPADLYRSCQLFLALP